MMEAKDTVMRDEQIIKLTQDIFRELIGDEIPVEHISIELIKPILGNQAEIFFEAGIKEVVEWVNKNIFWKKDATHSTSFYPKEWQAKLKEWGIEK